MVFQKQIYLNDLKATKDFAQFLVSKIRVPAILLLFGPLGIGKTQFVKFFAQFLGVNGISSPSFVKMQIYWTPQNQKLVHCDGFQLKSDSDINQFLDYFDADYLLLEWPEKFVKCFDKDEVISLFWSWKDDQQRVVEIKSYYKISESLDS